MRIAEIAPPWLAVPPSGYGGTEWVVALVADGLAERGHEVTLFATGDSRTKAELDYVFERAPGPTFINDPWHDTMHTLHAFRDRDRFDLFHIHSPWSALIVPALLGLKSVATVHGAFTPDMRRLYRALGDRMRFVAISENQRSHMPELPYAGVVYNGVDVSMYPFRAEKDPFLLFLGRAHPDKGVKRAVLAAREAGIPLVMAVKVAHPEEQEYWEREVAPVLSPDATVLGEVSGEEKLDLLSRAMAVLFPIGWDEPFGLVMTEAMACGTPVIATPRGSVPEIVVDGQTGFVVPEEGFADAAAACASRLDRIDPAACRKRVETLFSKEAMVQGYEEVFEHVLAG
jgi:glycosyltransferase involved in cell wall biosynthesis